jgi:hypothetical protein
MATKIVTKNSSTAGAAPTATDLVQGELAVNVADGRLYTEDNAAAIVELGVNPATEITANAGIALPDSQKATFGASDNLQIYSDGTNSFIKETAGAGSLIFNADFFTVQNAAGTETKLVAKDNAEVQLYYDNLVKLATTSTGIDVTGTASMDGLSLDNAQYINFKNSSNISTRALGINGANTFYVGGIDADIGDILFVDGGATRASFANGGDISFYEDTGTTAKLFWDASAESLGIGTSSPSSYVSSGSNLVIAGSAGSGMTIASGTGSAGNLFFADGTVTDSAYRGYVQYNHSTDSLQLGTAATERMRIDSAGRVGIGISSMVNPLHVGVTPNTASKTSGSAFNGGALRLDGNLANAGDESAILAGQTGSLSAGIGFMRESGATWGTALKFYTHSPAITTTDELTERMRIDSAGNVGIGTDAPATKLEVEGNSGAATGTVSAPVAIRITDTSDIASGGDIANPYAALQFFGRDISNEGPTVHAQIGTIYDDQFGAGSHLTFSTWNAGIPSAAHAHRQHR